jgi:hypothetical protein
MDAKTINRLPHEAEWLARVAARLTPAANGGQPRESRALREGCVR